MFLFFLSISPLTKICNLNTNNIDKALMFVVTNIKKILKKLLKKMGYKMIKILKVLTRKIQIWTVRISK